MPFLKTYVENMTKDVECDENYLVKRAKDIAHSNPHEAKAWMITARTLYPGSFIIQFEAYQIEKSARNIKEAAKCFSSIFQKFSDEVELWKEIQVLTLALRSNENDSESVFLRQMFSHIPPQVQHQLLLMTADRSEDTMEHCRLLLLLLRRFNQAIATLGSRLVETLMTAEKHSHYKNCVNCYRKLLICDLLPLIGSSTSVDISQKQLYRLLHKSVEFYLSYILSPVKLVQDLPENECKIDDPWANLFSSIEILGRKLGWELSAIFFHPWNEELYWQKINHFYKTRRLLPEDSPNYKQLFYCLTIFFLRCLYTYNNIIKPQENVNVPESLYILVEAFIRPPDVESEPRVKHKKTDSEDINLPLITVGKTNQSTPHLSHIFLMALKSWDMLHSSENLIKEFSKITTSVKLEPYLQVFLIDSYFFKTQYSEALSLLLAQQEMTLKSNLQVASIQYCIGNYPLTVQYITAVVTGLPPTSWTAINSNHQLIQSSRSTRHLHYLPLSKAQILLYCIKVLIGMLKKYLFAASDADLTIGYLLTLAQYDWPNEEELYEQLIERIKIQRSFTYSRFQNYIINVDMLEDFMYLTTESGGNCALEILQTQPHAGQRRISTRGTDKGVKEDFRMAMKRQVTRCEEPLDALMVKFIRVESPTFMALFTQ